MRFAYCFRGLVHYHHGREPVGKPGTRAVTESYILFQRQREMEKGGKNIQIYEPREALFKPPYS